MNKASYRQIYDLLGIDRAISPRIICANRILRFVRSSSVSAIAVIGEGRAEVLELEAHFREKRESHKVKNLGLPEGTVLGALVRGNGVIIPRGETVVEEGDHVILLTHARKHGPVGLDVPQDRRGPERLSRAGTRCSYEPPSRWLASWLRAAPACRPSCSCPPRSGSCTEETGPAMACLESALVAFVLGGATFLVLPRLDLDVGGPLRTTSGARAWPWWGSPG